MAHARFRHRSLGGLVPRTRFSDLLVDERDRWIVLDEKGRFIGWGRHQAAAIWERFSLPGGDDRRELPIQLDDWPATCQPWHHRTRNVLAHVRGNTRLTTDARRTLFLGEVQSDWHAGLHAQAKKLVAVGTENKIAAAPRCRKTGAVDRNKDAWKWPVKAAAKAANLPPATAACSSRHSVIGDLVHEGLDLLTVAQISGTSVVMIERHHGHPRGEVAATALARLAL